MQLKQKLKLLRKQWILFELNDNPLSYKNNLILL